MINFFKRFTTITSIIITLVLAILLVLDLSRINGILSDLFLRSITVLNEQSIQKLVVVGFLLGVGTSWMIQNILGLIFNKKKPITDKVTTDAINSESMTADTAK